METANNWAGDAAKGMAAAGMRYDGKDRKKHGFEPDTDFGKFIEQCVRESMERHGWQYR